MNILYISYDGILEPLGYSQVFNYLANLSSKNRKFFLLSFEKKKDLNKKSKVSSLSEFASKRNIIWTHLRYHSKPAIVASIFDMVCGLFLILRNTRNEKIDLIHIRGYLPMLIAIPLKFWFKSKLVFDMRGFWADEKADRASWNRKSLKFKFFKALEKYSLEISDHVICLTFHAKNLLIEKYRFLDADKISVIRTCVDMESFKIKNKKVTNKNLLVFGYLGSIDTAYDISKVLSLLESIQKDINFHLKILTNSNQIIIHEIASKAGLKKENYSIYQIEYKEVPIFLDSIDVGIFYLKDNFSIKASMPTKIGEFFAKGIPIVCNNFNNDISNLINEDTGVIFDFDDLNLNDLKKVTSLRFNDSEKIRDFAKAEFSLNLGVKQYDEIYNILINE